MVDERYLHDYHVGDRVEAEIRNSTQEFSALGYVSDINPLYLQISNIHPKKGNGDLPTKKISFALDDIVRLHHLNVQN